MNPRPRVLVADDDPAVRALIGDFLTFFGLEVSLAGDGDSALGLFRREAFDLVLTDYLMPGMNGVQFAEILRREAPDVPVAVITGSVTCDLLDQLRARDLAVLTKPFSLTDFQQTIERLLPPPR